MKISTLAAFLNSVDQVRVSARSYLITIRGLPLKIRKNLVNTSAASKRHE